MASSAMLALMTAGAFSVAVAQDQPATPPPAATEQPAVEAPADAAQPADQGATTDMAAGAPESELTPDEPTIATAFIGRSVYSNEEPDSDKIGDVNDLIISDDGGITHAVVGVGGFLGIGEKDVAVPFDELQVVEQDGDLRLIYSATKEQLEAAEEFDRTAYDPRARAAAEEQAAADAGGGMTPAPAPAGDMAATPPPAPEPAEPAQTAEAPATPPATEPAEPAQTAEAPATPPATEPAEPAQTAEAPATPPATEPAEPAQSAEAPATPAPDTAATTAPADQTAATTTASFMSFEPDQVRASTMLGQEVFGPDNQSIGEISDLVLEEDGQTRAGIVDVGGFLGVGEKKVAIPFDQIQVTKEGDEPRLTVAMTREQLEQATAWEQPGADMAATDQPAADAAAPADQTAAGQTPAAGGFEVATQDVSADKLIGAAVYSPNEENLGEVDDVVFDPKGSIQAVVVDVGGFLGVGEKPVALQFDALNIQKDVDGDMRLMVNATEEQLKSAPSYEVSAVPAQ